MGKAFATWLIAIMAAGTPTTPRDVVESAVVRITAIPGEMRSASSAELERVRSELRQIFGDFFDLDHMARRTLSHHWRGEHPSDGTEPAQLVVDLLHRSYVSLIATRSGAKIVHAPAVLAGTRASVRSTVSSGRAADVVLEHRLHLKGNRWKVHDVLVNGISLVSTWRREFDRTIATSSYRAAIEALRNQGARHPARYR